MHKRFGSDDVTILPDNAKNRFVLTFLMWLVAIDPKVRTGYRSTSNFRG